MKLATWLILFACALSGCVSGGNVSHADDPGATKRDDGPELCRDGNPPPCTPRD
jgi:hypothetical protein